MNIFFNIVLQVTNISIFEDKVSSQILLEVIM